MTQLKTKADIRSLRNIAKGLNDSFIPFNFKDDLTGEEIILSALPLPLGCRSIKDVKRKDKYRVHYTSYRARNHFRQLKELYKIENPVLRKHKILEYIDRFKITNE